MLLIGSHALKVQAPTALDREPRDYDFIATMGEVDKFVRSHRARITACYPTTDGKKMIVRGLDKPVEFDIAWPGSTNEALVRRAPQNRLPLGVDGGLVQLPTINQLFELKHSHRFLKNSPHFLKTMRDWRAMRAIGCRIEDAEWVRAREKETYTYAHPKLNVSKEAFFAGDGIVYTYDHDSIHEAVKRLDRPAYQYFKPEGSAVLCDRRLFEAAPEEVRLSSVIEEATVLALERSQIPHRGTLTPRRSFEMALMKVCTSITSGWWREYAYENHNRALSAYDDEYADKFWSAVAAGRVLPYAKP